jgi:hypothetical protein
LEERKADILKEEERQQRVRDFAAYVAKAKQNIKYPNLAN